jgi:hypothetical protein
VIASCRCAAVATLPAKYPFKRSPSQVRRRSHDRDPWGRSRRVPQRRTRVPSPLPGRLATAAPRSL